MDQSSDRRKRNKPIFSDRNLTISSAILGMLSIILAILVYRSPNPNPTYIVIRDLMIVGVLISAIVVLAAKYVRASQIAAIATKENKQLQVKNRKLVEEVTNNRVKIGELTAEGKAKVNKLEAEHKTQTNEILVQHKEELALAVRQHHIEMMDLVSRQLRFAHANQHEYRDLLFKYYKDAIPGNFEYQFGEADLRFFRRVCNIVTSKTRNSLQELFVGRGIAIGEDLCVTVKLKISSNSVEEIFKKHKKALDGGYRDQIQENDFWVITVYRDPHTYANNKMRGTVDHIYDITRNTAFNHLDSGETSFFLANNLNSLESNNQYINQNEKREEQYNSTLVLPIRHISKDGTKVRCFGFLAVDSRNASTTLYDNVRLPDHHNHSTGLFDESDCLEIMASGADLIASALLSIEMYHYDGDRSLEELNTNPKPEEVEIATSHMEIDTNDEKDRTTRTG